MNRLFDSFSTTLYFWSRSHRHFGKGSGTNRCPLITASSSRSHRNSYMSAARSLELRMTSRQPEYGYKQLLQLSILFKHPVDRDILPGLSNTKKSEYRITMTSPLAQANSIAASDPSQAEQLYKQILKDKAGEFALIICWPDVI